MCTAKQKGGFLIRDEIKEMKGGEKKERDRQTQRDREREREKKDNLYNNVYVIV